jgi:hypothetical protein
VGTVLKFSIADSIVSWVPSKDAANNEKMVRDKLAHKASFTRNFSAGSRQRLEGGAVN